MRKSPLETAQEKFKVKDRKKAKEKLVAAVKELAEEGLWVERVNDKKSLDNVSNRKLLHLHEVLSAVKKQFGGREKLIDAILKAEKREKDEGYKARLLEQPTPRLWDRYRSVA
jgi:hypothetical protein